MVLAGAVELVLENPSRPLSRDWVLTLGWGALVFLLVARLRTCPHLARASLSLSLSHNLEFFMHVVARFPVGKWSLQGPSRPQLQHPRMALPPPCVVKASLSQSQPRLEGWGQGQGRSLLVGGAAREIAKRVQVEGRGLLLCSGLFVGWFFPAYFVVVKYM